MSLHGQYDPDNIFAKIIKGEIPSVKIYEDDDTLCFMDAFPQSKGHCLVISKTAKARTMLDIEETDLAKIIRTVHKITPAVEKALSPDGIQIIQYNGAPAGQTVFHLHVHIIPRFEGDDMRAHASGQMADMGELGALAERIKAAL